MPQYAIAWNVFSWVFLIASSCFVFRGPWILVVLFPCLNFWNVISVDTFSYALFLLAVRVPFLYYAMPFFRYHAIPLAVVEWFFSRRLLGFFLICLIPFSLWLTSGQSHQLGHFMIWQTYVNYFLASNPGMDLTDHAQSVLVELRAATMKYQPVINWSQMAVISFVKFLHGVS